MWVLDASAVLAFLHGERGADVVSDALADVSVVSAANWAEVLSKFSDEGEDPDAIAEGVESEGLCSQDWKCFQSPPTMLGRLRGFVLGLGPEVSRWATGFVLPWLCDWATVCLRPTGNGQAWPLVSR